MKFGPIKVSKALGAILAHAYTLPSGRLKKGRRLEATDIAALINADIDSIIVAQLQAGDVEENEAARRISDALQSNNIIPAHPFTGRVNLHANHAGIFNADRETIDKVNRITPAITIATLADGVFVEAGRLVATVKIIPFAVAGVSIQQVEKILEEQALSLSLSKPQQITLIATQIASLKLSTMDKTARVLQNRLKLAGSELIEEIRTVHRAKDVAEAIENRNKNSSVMIIFGASAITDIDDVIPMGLRMAGGDVETFGMPVDPGNLLLTGRLGNIPVIGAPGCARSPAENGFDWVLQRILAGIAVDENYISGLGVGGLLMEIHSRPQPRTATKGEA